MKEFKGGTPLRLVLHWEPPVTYEDPSDWENVLANRVDTPEVREVLGHFDEWEIRGSEIYFYMHTTKRRSELKKMMRHNKGWLAFVRENPNARWEWAEEVL